MKVDGTRRPRWGKRRWRTVAVGLPVAVVFFFGIVHIFNVSISLINVIKDDPKPPFPSSWGPLKQFEPGEDPDLTGLTRDVTPIHCHSHNDYWRRIPLYEALKWGCTGVEADVWLFDDDLFVGHSTNALTRDRTFASMYVEPLMRILDRQNAIDPDFATSEEAAKNGVYEVDPTQTLVLLVDFKNDGHAIFPFVSAQVAPFREKGYLSYFDGNSTIPGPITVVATGNAPFDYVIENATYRDIFFDAPLDRLYQEPFDGNPPTMDPKPSANHPTIDLELHRHAPLRTKRESGQGTVGTDPDSHFDLTNSYYASVDFKKAIGWAWFGQLSEKQLKLIRGQVQGARKAGLKARYWGTPSWPVGLRNRVWDVLIEEGVDYLNGDDLRAMTKLDWGLRRHWGWLG
ncbi:hypothetical protein K458DRAFT_316751 [Lentithecium fluviatile CBS 122367]|uniref:Altered inheritance of mitochondria protein 6 n=1 Tax=Lentithecium fluviatile CBS 122367 TaxID=1168545 RepID=A0A6G1IJU7_9PLEO|nr:hypothetical protein K458DRAFT_316751 [Lentithecium fluviatile CBS 122367]